ncbi:phosphotriesterase family protein [Marinilabilia rubra]|uniref:Aryldialkylphosphatase n=1 Tax=Marinilabilia rubra TaxID=2162893 RepID=A0A2U2B4J2_9BACT|nr:aryldialkylphosphatase [Marinilabilia rubra]PWD97957.1 aryldialkylphosphatase [Marinilabilia rubra]
MKNVLVVLVLTLIISGCNPDSDSEKLITVKGEIPVEEMGVSLIHEHVIVDWIGVDSTGAHRWDKSKVVERALPFFLEAKDKGVNTFFACTPAFLGRDPIVLKELSEKSGIDIVTNTGYYGAGNNKFVPKHAFEDSAEEIARVWIDEFQNGIEGTGIYPGFIKVAVDRNDTLSAMHNKIIRAAAIAHKATGLTIVSHTGPDGPAFSQLKILKEEGVSPEAFVWTHAQAGTLPGHIKAARQGAWISIDNLRYIDSGFSSNTGNVDWFVDRLTALKNENVLDKVLISHDSGWYNVGQENGGDYRGYTDIFEHLIPALKENGFSQEDIDLLLVKNPQRAYGVKVRSVE